MRAGSFPASAWPPTSELDARIRIDLRIDADARRRALASDVRGGLTTVPRRLPPKYFYDAVGSALFDRITRLPEYYLTRTEQAILDARGAALMRALGPVDVVEIGAGTATKIRPLLRAGTTVRRYVPVDVDAATMRDAAQALVHAFPRLCVHGLAGDFERDLGHVPPAIGPRLVIFFGSTLGNLDPGPRRTFLESVRRLLDTGDHFLLGVDLMKDVRILHAAYDDAAGVTAAFNRNVLHVINRELGGDFRADEFRHVAHVDEAAERVEMHLVAERKRDVTIRALDLSLHFEVGEGIWTESSYKFTRRGAEAMLADADLALERWFTDPGDRFALALASPAS